MSDWVKKDIKCYEIISDLIKESISSGKIIDEK